jgi:hypothetical protein
MSSKANIVPEAIKPLRNPSGTFKYLYKKPTKKPFTTKEDSTISTPATHPYPHLWWFWRYFDRAPNPAD